MRSLPFPAPKGVDWWIRMPPEEALRNPNRFLVEGEGNDIVSINLIGDTAYLLKTGNSVRH